MTVTGSGQIIRNPDSSGGTGTWRGLSLVLDGTVLEAAGALVAVPFDTINQDTDGIASTVPIAVGSITIPTGACGVVPAGMAGLWRCSANLLMENSASGPVTWGGMILFAGTALRYITFQADAIVGPLPITPDVFTLAVNDRVWCRFKNFGTDGTYIQAGIMLMEYLGPGT